jgi:hypothetical protein
MDLLFSIAITFTLCPYALYTWAYKFPASFSRLLTQGQLVEIAQWMKLICVACSLPTMYQAGMNGPGLVIGLPLAILGQYLSEVVYSLLGDAGVYYGIELGTVKPRRITGFPFHVSNPQYRGAVMTVIGLMMCVNITREIVMLITAWLVAYFYEICVENTKGGVIMPEPTD